ncbi:toxin Cry1Ac domain D-VI-related protein [Listeria monocytogenes]
MEKKRKIMIGVSVAVGVLMLGGAVLGFHNYSVKADQKEMALKQSNSEVKALQEEINKYFTNSKKENIVASFKKEDVKGLLEKAKKLPKNMDNAKAMQTITTDIDDLMKMVYAREKVASLLDDQQVLVAGANIQLAQADVDRLKTKKPVFAEEQQKVIDEANNQKKIIDEATAKANNLYTNDKKTEVKSDVTRDAYNLAKEAVDKIKQKQSKESLTISLDTVNKFLNEKDDQKQAAAQKNQQNIATNDSETANSNESRSKASGNNSSSSSSGGNQSSNGNGATAKSSGGNNSTSKSGGSSASKASGGSSKSVSGNSESKASGGSGSSSSSKSTWTEENEMGGTNIYEGW